MKYMEKIKTEILDMLNIIFEEKENFNCDNNYLKICNKLRDLMTKVDRSEELESILEDVLQNSDNMGELAKQLKGEGEQ